MNAIKTFFKTLFNWFKSLPVFWKKLISYLLVLLLGMFIGFAITGYILGRMGAGREKTISDLTGQLTTITKTANRIQTDLDKAKRELEANDNTIRGLEKSDRKKSTIINDLRGTNSRLAEANRRLKEEIERLRSGNTEFKRISTELESLLAEYKGLIGQSVEGIDDAQRSIEAIIQIIRGLQAGS